MELLPLLFVFFFEGMGDEVFVNLNAEGTRGVSISGYRGKKYVAIREYYSDAGGVKRPGSFFVVFVCLFVSGLDSN